MVFDLFDADGLTGEDQTEIDLLPFVADASACCDGDRLVVQSSSVGRRIDTTGDYRGADHTGLGSCKVAGKSRGEHARSYRSKKSALLVAVDDSSERSGQIGRRIEGRIE